MIAIVRKNLAIFVSKQNRNNAGVWKSPNSRHFSSISTETQSPITPTLVDILRNKYDFPPESASRAASELSYLKSPHNADSVLSFLKESGFSDSHLQKIVKNRPRVLGASLEGSIRPKIKILGDMGLSSDDICRIIASNPTILQLSVINNIIPSFSVLKGLFGSDMQAASIVRRAPRILTVNSDNTLMANFEFLKSFGVATGRIKSVIVNYPASFLQKPEILRKSAEKVKEMGVDPSSKAFPYAISTVASCSEDAWERKLQAFKGLGFSESDILSMFGRKPSVFMISVEKLKKTTEFLVATGKFDLSCIAGCPMSLMFNSEKRFEPRVRVLKILESRNLIEKWPSLAMFCRLSDADFFDRFVKPYADEVDDPPRKIRQTNH